MTAAGHHVGDWVSGCSVGGRGGGVRCDSHPLVGQYMGVLLVCLDFFCYYSNRMRVITNLSCDVSPPDPKY